MITIINKVINLVKSEIEDNRSSFTILYEKTRKWPRKILSPEKITTPSTRGMTQKIGLNSLGKRRERSVRLSRSTN